MCVGRSLLYACIGRQSKDEEDEFRDKIRQSSSSVSKIKSALDFMRNKQLEVPFIASYKKEYIVPELTSNALWRIYKWDEKVGIRRRSGEISC